MPTVIEKRSLHSTQCQGKRADASNVYRFSLPVSRDMEPRRPSNMSRPVVPFTRTAQQHGEDTAIFKY